MAKGATVHIERWARRRSGTNEEQTRFPGENLEEAWEMGWIVHHRSGSRKIDLVSQKEKRDERRPWDLTRWSGR